ncbi:unnamed protein product [Citrullus colocynthis]|uniref:Uncharacterized protein n=1 Tax=Citrullus colocynthis TaxID=252529 RepID=A0ABP0Z923_9ROSI
MFVLTFFLKYNNAFKYFTLLFVYASTCRGGLLNLKPSSKQRNKIIIITTLEIERLFYQFPLSVLQIQSSLSSSPNPIPESSPLSQLSTVPFQFLHLFSSDFTLFSAAFRFSLPIFFKSFLKAPAFQTQFAVVASFQFVSNS